MSVEAITQINAPSAPDPRAPTATQSDQKGPSAKHSDPAVNVSVSTEAKKVYAQIRAGGEVVADVMADGEVVERGVSNTPKLSTMGYGFRNPALIAARAQAMMETA